MRLLLPILLSGGRANLLAASDKFSASSWTKNNVTVTDDAVVSPRGTLTADQLVSSAGELSYVYQDYTTTQPGMYAGSLYLRTGTPQNIIFRLQQRGGAGGDYSVTCAVTTEWQRFEVAAICAAGVTAVRVNILPDGANNFDVYAWGAKLEAGPKATRYRT